MRFINRLSLLGTLFLFSLCWSVTSSASAEDEWFYWTDKGKKFLTYGVPESDFPSIFHAECRNGKAHVNLDIFPPGGKKGDKTATIFRNGSLLVQHTATLTVWDSIELGVSEYVEFVVPTTDKLFDLFMPDGPIFAAVPGATLTLPSQNGRARETKKFITSCVAR